MKLSCMMLVALGLLVGKLEAQEADDPPKPIAPPPLSPQYSLSFSGSEYAHVPAWLPYDEAQAVCVASGGYVVSINDDHENEAVIEWLGGVVQIFQPVWIGFRSTHINSRRYSYGWDDGTSFISGTSFYTAWAPGGPRDEDGRIESCTVYSADLGGWNDAKCDESWTFVCERPTHSTIETDLFPCCREEMVGGVPRACYVDETCLNSPPGIFGGLGCNADGTANCRFCGWGPYAEDIACPQGQGVPPTPTPTPAPVKYTPPPAPEVDFFPCCREEMFGGVPRACYVDETCLEPLRGFFSGRGCNADGNANCRFCGWGPYAEGIPCPQGQGVPPTPTPTPAPVKYTPPPVPEVDFFPCCREEMVGGVPRACYVDETCLNSPPGIFGGLGCNADGTANCRFCGWGPYAEDIKCPQGHGGPTPAPAPTPAPVYYPPPTIEPTPAPVTYTPPPVPGVDCAKLGWPGSCGAFTDEASCNCWVKSVFGCSWSHGRCKH